MNGIPTTPSVDIQLACEATGVPGEAQLRQWVHQALTVANAAPGEITVRIVDSDEIQTLNREYRKKDKPTNVLSFPFEMPEGLPADAMPPILGDIIICAPVVHQQAQAQAKPLEAHWAHMVTHGVLHLLGYDHIEDDDAQIMEALEIQALGDQGYADPYQTPDDL